MKNFFGVVIFCCLMPLSVCAAEYIDDAERLKPMWKQLDANADGLVETGELHPALAGAIKRSDRDGDGRISLEEYVQFDLDPGGSAFLPLAENVRLIQDIPYAASDDPRQQLDVYLPRKATVEGSLPVIAYVHGGGFRQGSKVMARSQIMSLVNSGRYAAVSIAYDYFGPN